VRRECKTATLYDVARIAGVSTATVSRIVHGQDRVRPATRERVQKVIDELGYVPDSAAQSLSRRRKEIIGLVSVERFTPQYDVENMSLLFYDEILRGVEPRLRDEGWSLLLTYLPGEDPHGFARLQSLSGKVDGLLIGEGVVPSSLLSRIAQRVPVVVIAGNPGESGVDVVTADNRSGAAALVEHLVCAHGHTRFFHVDGPASAPDAQERRVALELVLARHPRCRLIGSVRGEFSVRSGVEAGEHLLTTYGRRALPDAIVCANDPMAIGVMQSLARAGVRVPEDLAVVGFDDIYPGSLSHPSLTTVHQPMRMIGERACTRLLDRIARPELDPEVVVIPTELVLRESCGCSPSMGTRAVPPRLAVQQRSGTLQGAVTIARSDGQATKEGRKRSQSGGRTRKAVATDTVTPLPA